MISSFALAFLLSASDSFGIDWTPANSGWTSGLRGIPAALTPSPEGLHFRSIGPGDGPQFYEDDMVRTLPAPLLFADHPLIVMQVMFPPFETWPMGGNNTGNRMYFRFRIIAVGSDDFGGSGVFYPGFFIGRSPTGEPYFAFRTLVDHTLLTPIPQAGPWTIAIGFDDAGLIEFYAAPGYVAITAADKLPKPPEAYPRYLKSISQLFLQLSNDVTAPGLSEPDWVIRSVACYTQLPPLSASAESLSCSGYPGAEYALETSVDLSSWSLDRVFTQSLNQPARDGFYRLHSINP